MRILTIIILLFSINAFADYYKTLPKGVRMIDLRQISTMKITSSYNRLATENPYSYSINLDANVFADLPFIGDEMKEIKAISPEAYNMFSVGEYGIKADAQVNVNVFAMGWGITNRLTAYFGIPFYKANVKINYNRVKGDNHDATAAELHKAGNSDADALYENVVETLENYDINGEFLQSVVVDQFNYKPVGNWQGNDYGDMEVGMIYRLTNLRDKGAAVQAGVIVPTGYVEDPSILQDISFGDGQYDIFAEVGGGLFLTPYWILNGSFRFVYQMEGNRDMRVPLNEDFALGDETDNYDFKLGNKYIININTKYDIKEWLNVRLGYESEIIEQAVYKSDNAEADRILGLNTDTTSHNIRIGATLSSVSLFQRGRFYLPGTLDISGLYNFSGKNTPRVNRIEMQLRMYF